MADAQVVGQDDVAINDMLVSWKKLELKKGDVLAVLIPANVHMPYDRLNELAKRVQSVVKEWGVPVMLLTDGVTLASVSTGS